MRTRDDIPQDTYVYRRVLGSNWKSDGNKEIPKDSAFIDKQESLSVFIAEMTTPRSVLQQMIDGWKAAGKDSTLANNGSTVEELVKHGWRVVKTPLKVLTDTARLTVKVLDDNTIDPSGHIELCGEVLDFNALIHNSEVLTPDRCCELGSNIGDRRGQPD